jgi:hypothetical protein
MLGISLVEANVPEIAENLFDQHQRRPLRLIITLDLGLIRPKNPDFSRSEPPI